jgi:prevent-host-death family protein
MIKMINLSSNKQIHQIGHLGDITGMPTVSATYAKRNFGAMIDAAQSEPVHIARHNKEVAVLISIEEYERARGSRWAEFDRLSTIAAEQAKATGLTEKRLQKILSEE